MRKSRRFGVHNLIDNASEEEDAKMYLYAPIGGWDGIRSKDFISALDTVETKRLHLHINSPGGDVFEGLAIANAMREHDARVIVHVDAIAASIASIIAIAGDFVRMADNAFLMIHDPYTFAMGNAAELRKNADLLDKVGGSLINEYVKRTGQDEKQVTAWMNAETWFDAQEAKTHGFIDAIDGQSKTPVDAFDLSVFNKIPPKLLAREAEEPTIRDTETALRDAGFSRTEARRMASAAMAARIRNPREEEAGISPVSTELKDAFAQLGNHLK